MFFILRILWSESAADHLFLTLPERESHHILWDGCVLAWMFHYRDLPLLIRDFRTFRGYPLWGLLATEDLRDCIFVHECIASPSSGYGCFFSCLIIHIWPSEVPAPEM